LTVFSTDRADLERGAKDICAPRYAGLRYSPVVVVQAVEDRSGDQLAIGGLLASQFRVRVGDSVDSLVDAAFVVPTDIGTGNGAKLSLVPDQDAVQQLSAQGADEALDMRGCVGGVIGSGDSPDAHSVGEPNVERGAAGDLLAVGVDRDRLAELAEDAVVA